MVSKYTHTLTLLAQFEVSKMTKKTELDRVTKALAERDPDAVVTLSATVSEQEADAKADVAKSIRFAMRVCQDQTTCT